ncbi:MAG: ABC transporter permease [Candidatus Latescibacterota bacterium]|jgi:phospholipid/cholesterol/gamma-HCH transport system permease protein
MNGDHSTTTSSEQPARFELRRDDGGRVVVELWGNWLLAAERPRATDVVRKLESGPAVTRLCFESVRIGDWDTGLMTFLIELNSLCVERGIVVEPGNLPDGVRRLYGLASAQPETGTGGPEGRKSFFEMVGESTAKAATDSMAMVSFVGEVTVAFGRLLAGKARMRRRDVALFLQETGAEALPIVSLISFLVGVILAFVGAVQLRQFGAQIYVANLVALAMTREMAAMMTAIILAGRTGAAFAAQLGTMTVNEEVDALRTSGVSPIEHLVLPRLIALSLMMPLLALYADFVGMLGGAAVGVSMLDLSLVQYVTQTRDALSPLAFLLGLIKASVYGVVVAISGCFYGMGSGRSAAAVGSAVTSAVVMGILMIIIASAITTILYNQLGV